MNKEMYHHYLWYSLHWGVSGALVLISLSLLVKALKWVLNQRRPKAAQS